MGMTLAYIAFSKMAIAANAKGRALLRLRPLPGKMSAADKCNSISHLRFVGINCTSISSYQKPLLRPIFEAL